LFENAGKVVEALKQQPVILALVLLQAFVLAAVLYNSINRQEAVSKQFNSLYELLSMCLKHIPDGLPQRGDLVLPLGEGSKSK
jgi:uncharacterized protein involved in propanediol utilization